MQALLTKESAPKIETSTNWQLAHEAYPGAVEAARQKAGRLIGSLAMEETVQVESVLPSPESATLQSSLMRAKQGDTQALRSVEMNVQTNMAELLFKAGHQTSVQLDIEAGRLKQNGQLLTDIQANAIRYSSLNEMMYQRTRQEIENAHTFEELIAGDVLDTHDAVVFSLSPEDQKTKRDYGFFEETETCSIQMLKKSDNTVELETALVAGKSSALAERHDKTAVETIAREHGVQVEIGNSEDSLRHILLIPKHESVHGINDVIRSYDKAVGEDVFYGQAVEKQPDYLAHAEQCIQKNDSFSDAVAMISRQLLAEADNFRSPIDAVKRLHKLTEASLVSRAISDDTIDERVFGRESARYIESARVASSAGNQQEAMELRQKAVEVAVSSSCPMSFSSAETENPKEDASLALYGEDKYGKLAFRCPKMGCLNVRQPGKLLEKCGHCSADVRC